MMSVNESARTRKRPSGDGAVALKERGRREERTVLTANTRKKTWKGRGQERGGSRPGSWTREEKCPPGPANKPAVELTAAPAEQRTHWQTHKTDLHVLCKLTSVHARRRKYLDVVEHNNSARNLVRPPAAYFTQRLWWSGLNTASLCHSLQEKVLWKEHWPQWGVTSNGKNKEGDHVARLNLLGSFPLSFCSQGESVHFSQTGHVLIAQKCAERFGSFSLTK